MDNFLELMAEIMEVDADSISAETEFREACDFDSLMGFSMICMIEEEYGAVVAVDQFRASKTIGDLFAFTEK